MKIEVEKQRQIIHIGDLEVGTVLRDPSDDRIYMKTEYIDDDGDEINSIDLTTGNLGGFYDEAKGYDIDGTLYIKE